MLTAALNLLSVAVERSTELRCNIALESKRSEKIVDERGLRCLRSVRRFARAELSCVNKMPSLLRVSRRNAAVETTEESWDPRRKRIYAEPER